MRIYEELFIVKKDASEEEVDQFIEQIQELITSGGGTVDKLEKWGTRRLAYHVKRQAEGLYFLLQFTSPPGAVKELERRLRVADIVLKYLTVRIDEKLKWLEKRKKKREKRAARRPVHVSAPPPAAPQQPAAPQAPRPPEPEAPEVVAPEAVVVEETPKAATEAPEPSEKQEPAGESGAE